METTGELNSSDSNVPDQNDKVTINANEWNSVFEHSLDEKQKSLRYWCYRACHKQNQSFGGVL